jgi:hypothetical protein
MGRGRWGDNEVERWRDFTALYKEPVLLDQLMASLRQESEERSVDKMLCITCP